MASLELVFDGPPDIAVRYIQCLECSAVAEKCEGCGDYVCFNKHIILKNLNYKYGPCGETLCCGKEIDIRESNYANLRKPRWIEKPEVVVANVKAGDVELEPIVRKSWWKRLCCCC